MEGQIAGAKLTVSAGFLRHDRPVDVDTKGRRLMANPFVHVELNTTDPDKAKAFYRELFTWTMDDMQMGPDMTYTMIQPGEGTGGGLMKQPMPGAPSAWLAYVDVDDVKRVD
jgi:predicted enzyme related to lactoylglutathione lyase